MKEINVNGKKRTDVGKKASKLLRKEGLVPCNLYGEEKGKDGLPVAMAFAACTKEQLPVADYDIIPQPKEVRLNEEKPFELNFKTVVYYEAGLEREAMFLSEYVSNILCIGLNQHEYHGQTDGIVLNIVSEDFTQAEAYEINVTPKQVIIKGADAAGVFYGIQTLRKSIPVSRLFTDPQQNFNVKLSDISCQLPCGTIRDWPNFSYRGMHLDPCRHFIPLDSVKVYIDMLAMHNMNQFHFHLSDDQGWRLVPTVTAQSSGIMATFTTLSAMVVSIPKTSSATSLSMPPSVTSTSFLKLICRVTCRLPWLAIRIWVAPAVLTRCGSVGACRKTCFAQVTRRPCCLSRMCSTR